MKREITEKELETLLDEGWEVNGKLRAKGVERLSLVSRGKVHRTALVRVVGEEAADAADKAAAQ